MERTFQFERTEFNIWLGAVKVEMAKRRLDVLLVSETPNLNYLTGYDAYSSIPHKWRLWRSTVKNQSSSRAVWIQLQQK